jgi:hypothetical protein
MASKSQIIKDKISQSGSGFVSVYFFKKDGTERQMTFNPLHFGEVLGTGSKMKDPDAVENIVRCMDVKKGWRSFDCRRVFRMRVNGEIIEFREDENNEG